MASLSNLFNSFAKSHNIDFKLIKKILILFLATRLVYILLIGISTEFIVGYIPTNEHHLAAPRIERTVWSAKSLRLWDANFYVDIAEKGFGHDTEKYFNKQASSIGFFPAYPVSIMLAKHIVPKMSTEMVGIILSNLYFLFAAYFLYKVIKDELGESVADKSLLLLFAMPGAIVYSGIMTESMFLLLTVLVIYFGKRDKWTFASIAASIGIVSRPVGFLILIPFAFIYFKRFGIRIISNFRTIVKIVLIVPLCTLAFLWINYVATGDPLAMIHIQKAAWGHEISNPIKVIQEFLFTGNLSQQISMIWLLATVALFGVFAKKLPLMYVVFGIAMVLILPLTKTIHGAIRYILPIFSLYPLLAIVARKETVFTSLLIAFSLIQGALIVFWVGTFYITI